jgi:penicillin-binding protein 1A
LLTIAVVAALAVSLSLGWFYFYSADLPNFAELARFLPEAAATVSDECSGTEVRALPSASFGENLQNAMRAAEGPGDEVFARQVALSLFCNSRTDMLKRHLLEYKASVQLRRRFTSTQLLTMYLNRAYFGRDLIGVETASMHYFGKPASELDIPQALIAGLLRAPTMYSPERHPDQARARRDAIINGMLESGTITAEQAGAAKQIAIQ